MINQQIIHTNKRINANNQSRINTQERFFKFLSKLQSYFHKNKSNFGKKIIIFFKSTHLKESSCALHTPQIGQHEESVWNANLRSAQHVSP